MACGTSAAGSRPVLRTPRSVNRSPFGSTQHGDRPLPKPPLPPVPGETVVVAPGGDDGRAVRSRADKQVIGGGRGRVAVDVDQGIAGDMLAPATVRHQRRHQCADRAPTFGDLTGQDESGVLGEQLGPLVKTAIVASLAVFAQRPPDLVLVLP